MTADDATVSASRFTSDRERRLWLVTTVAVVGIYSTLGLARTLADRFGNDDLLVAFFAFGMLLTGATVVASRLERWPRAPEIAVLLGIGTVYLMVFQRMGMAVERSHLFEYGIVALFVYEALLERRTHGRLGHSPALLAILATGSIGVIDEVIQAFLPFRVFDPVDMLFNVIAATMAVLAAAAITKVASARS